MLDNTYLGIRLILFTICLFFKNQIIPSRITASFFSERLSQIFMAAEMNFDILTKPGVFGVIFHLSLFEEVYNPVFFRVCVEDKINLYHLQSKYLIT